MSKEDYQRRKRDASLHGWTKKIAGKTYVPYGPFYVPNGVKMSEIQQYAKDFRAEGFSVRTGSEKLKDAPFGNKARVFLYLHKQGW